MFDGPSYDSGPAAYLFVNGSFTGASGNTVAGDGIGDDNGLIDFTGNGASEVTFFGANRANGGSVGFNVFGVDDTTLLASFTGANGITQTSLAGSPLQTILSSSTLGGAIGSIEFDLPGPAANPPYVLAIDTFTATAAVPEPSSAALFIIGLCGMAARRRRS